MNQPESVQSASSVNGHKQLWCSSLPPQVASGADIFGTPADTFGTPGDYFCPPFSGSCDTGVFTVCRAERPPAVL